MKKSLIAMAMAAAIAAPAANANVVIYGKVHVSIDHVESESSDARWAVSSNSSRIGFKGTEDLGNGLSLIWKAETGYDFADGGAWSSSGRNAYIGLTGDWGTFLYGNHDTALKMSTAKLDIFSDTIADYDESIDFDDERWGQNIMYISPNMNGLTFAVNGAVHAGDGPEEDLFQSYSLAAMYSNNGLYLSAAYEFEDDSDSDDDETNWRLGAGYDMNNVHVGFVYEDTDQESDNSSDGYLWQLSGSYTFGNNVVKAMYGAEVLDDGDDDESGWAVGFDHMLSKRSKVYAVYVDTDNDIKNHYLSGDDQKGFSVGMIHKF
ncbi:porin [Solemya velum gill symbiont]|uniref:porin n=1 Tax=Solemya velum gill symbiont TaxID=2340 RepID=UPI0009977DD3|nr:porin [Solemya velum gill symbiont]OOZ00046.1 hypothetical protein BOW19_02635 [Solemya velum gill symbiont]OOZ02175.1 hypothetical protein BOW20_02635 [Solemya velum gill symbiont]OOZ04447.1 hypothetical protein BOW21_02140 [Solemya velum gill symbiont]OOZ06689.1 hypothetical protein BOW22_02125 [Solemya velum gill symbiont]OOZ08872.1 hypothetical protein BOW23_02120 [Solemya velum gill symbiont]